VEVFSNEIRLEIREMKKAVTIKGESYKVFVKSKILYILYFIPLL